MAKRKRYSDNERSTAVLFLEAQGYPHTPGALQRTSDYLKIPQSTLSRWARGVSNPPPANIVTEKRKTIIELLRDEIYAVLGEMTKTREDTDYRTLATAFGIFVDKLQLLEGKPTERVENIGDLSVIDRANRIAAILDAARERRDQRPADGTDILH
jgi:hypothetical protein